MEVTRRQKREEPAPFPNNAFEVRVPPQDLEAEQAVLGAMIQSKDAVDVVSEIMVAEDFYREAHRKLFSAIMTLHEIEEPVDVITLTNELKRVNEFDMVGGTATLSALLERTPTAANAGYYAEIVKEKSASRKLIRAGTSIVGEAYLDSMPIKEQMDLAEFRIFEATDNKTTQGFVAIKDIIGEVYEEVYETIGAETHVTGLPMGISRLDALTRGLQPSKLYIIGARPGVGKTALAINIAWNVASGKNSTGTKFPVGIFSLEMTRKEIGQRLLCAVGNVDYMSAKEGMILARDRASLVRASSRIHETNIFIDDSSAMSIMELKAKARRLKKTENIKLLVVDYLQLLDPGVKKDNREQEIAYISKNLKALTKDLDIPIVVASQLSRPMKGTEGKPPTLSDLRESGAIEQDANVVVFIHKWHTKEDGWRHKLMLSKQRNGPTDEDIPINFEAFSTTFKDVDIQERREVED